MTTTKQMSDSPVKDHQTTISFLRQFFDGDSGRSETPTPGPWDSFIREAIFCMPPGVTGLYHDDLSYYLRPPRPNWLLFSLLRMLDGTANATQSSFPRRATEFSPLPDPWSRTLGASGMASLNPQPLPPRLMFAVGLANELIVDAVRRQELVELLGNGGSEGRVRLRIRSFVDDWCGTSWRRKWPFPWPPPNWWREEIDGTELAVMGIQFEEAAKRTFNKDLQQTFADAGSKFLETGLSRMT